MKMSFNTADLEKGIAELGSRMPRAITRSLKRAAISGRQEVVKDISDDTGLPVAKTRAALQIRTVSADQVNIEVSGKRIPLIEFAARGPEPSRGRGRGVSYRNPGGGRGRIADAFIATMPTGHRGVFQRAPGSIHKKGSKGKGWTELPIREKFGPSLVLVFRKFVPQMQERAQEALVVNLRAEIAALGK